MNLTISRKLMLGSFLSIGIFVGLAASFLINLERINSLQDEAVKLAGLATGGAEATSAGADLYAIIADAEINRELSQTDKDWKEKKEDVTKRLGELDAEADRPDELAAMKKARQNYDALVATFENEMLPALRNTKEITEAVRELDGKIDKLREEMTAGLTDFREIQQKQVKESDDTMSEVSDHAIKLSVTLSTLGILAAMGIAFWLARGISRPIRHMTDVMRKLADGDKGIEIPGTSRQDEIGKMANAVLVFKENMLANDRLVAQQEAQKKQAEEDKRRSMHKLADDFEQSVGNVVKGVAAGATEMRASSEALRSTAEDVNHKATVVAAASEEASSNVQTVASAAEQLSASIREISQRVEESSRIAKKAVDEAQKTNTTMSGLAQMANKIGEVLELISGIAKQTNLLALNATIEAARAGEAGKGFAVVASEVKTLANQTAKATEEIESQIKEIQIATGDAVKAIELIGGTISEINGISTMVATAVEEQTAATQEIARNVQEASKGTSEVSSNIMSVSAASQMTGTAANEMLSAASELSSQAEKLRQEMDAFLAQIRAS